MSGLFGKTIKVSENEISSIQLQTSVQGVAIPIIYGRHRTTGNIIWYGDFTPIANTTTSGGGKGGASIQSTTYTYDLSVAIGICEGPISGYGSLWIGSQITTDAAIGLTEFLGTNPQTPWSYLSTNHPDQALSYPNLAYIARAAFQLGNSTALPNMSWEVNGLQPKRGTPYTAWGGSFSIGLTSSHITLTGADLTATLSAGLGYFCSAAGNGHAYAESGAFGCEFTVLATDIRVGIVLTSVGFPLDGANLGSNSQSYGYYSDGSIHYNGVGSAYGASFTVGDVITVVFNPSAKTLNFWKNGFDQGIAFSAIAAVSWNIVANIGTSGSSVAGNFAGPFLYPIPVPAPVYATLDPSQCNYRIALTNGNLTASMTAAAQNWGSVKANIYSAIGSGQYYCEVTVQNPVQYALMVGLATAGAQTADGYFCGIDNNGISYTSAGVLYTGNFNEGNAGAFTSGCIVGMKYDAGTRLAAWYINNVLQLSFTVGPGQSFTPCLTLWSNSGTTTATVNFGASPWVYAPGGSYTGWYGQPYAPDLTPAAVVYDLLTNTQYGALFPTAQIDALTDWDSYCSAMGFLISASFDSPTSASSIVKELAQIGNAEPVWSQGILKFIPYADAAVGSYTPNTTINYALTDDAFIAPAGEDPIKITRKRQADAFNSVSVSGVDRGNSYNPCTYTAQDQALIDQYGVLQAESLTFKEICTLPVMQLVAQTILQRQAYFRNLYEFTVSAWTYARLEPMDLVSLTDAGLGLSAWPVRILSVTEDAEDTLKIQAEDFFGGVANPSANNIQPGGGTVINNGITPATTGTPTVVQPLISFTGTPKIYIGAAAQPGAPGLWGGCQVWISTDNITYTQVGTINAPATFGVTSSTLPYAADPDSTSTLGVDLTGSTGTLASVPQSSADALLTLAFLDNYIGELIAYEAATLTSASHYNLTYLRRGAFQTLDEAHAAGVPFMLLNGAPLALTCPAAYVGQTVYIKLPSISPTGVVQDISLVSPTTYTVQRIGMVVGGAIPITVPAYNYLLVPGGSKMTIPANELVCNGEALALGELILS